jgi:hypothetical protein
MKALILSGVGWREGTSPKDDFFCCCWTTVNMNIMIIFTTKRLPVYRAPLSHLAGSIAVSYLSAVVYACLSFQKRQQRRKQLDQLPKLLFPNPSRTPRRSQSRVNVKRTKCILAIPPFAPCSSHPSIVPNDPPEDAIPHPFIHCDRRRIVAADKEVDKVACMCRGRGGGLEEGHQGRGE